MKFTQPLEIKVGAGGRGKLDNTGGGYTGCSYPSLVEVKTGAMPCSTSGNTAVGFQKRHAAENLCPSSYFCSGPLPDLPVYQNIIYIHMHMHMHMHIHIHIHIHTHIHIHMHIHICIYILIQIHLHIHIHIQQLHYHNLYVYGQLCM